MAEAISHVRSEGGRRSKTRGQDHELVAPDGGWGYAVCVGMSLIFILGYGSSSSFGILFIEFFSEQGSGGGGGRGVRSDITLTLGVHNGSLAVFGFLCGLALKRYSFRQMGFVGALLFIISDILTVFVTRTYQIVLTFGLIRGAGLGIMIPVGYTAFNCYFSKKKTAMICASHVLISTASIVFYMLVVLLLQTYGFRGTLALLMAIDLNLIVAILVLHPIEWHLVVRPIVQDEIEGPNFEQYELQELVIESADNIEASNSRDNDSSVQDIDVVENASTKTQIDENSGLIAKTIWNKINQYLDLDLLCCPRFLSTLVGIGFAFVSDVTYLALEPELLISYNYHYMAAVVYLLMIGTTSHLIATCLLAVYALYFNVNVRNLFFIGVCITIFMRIALVSGGISSYYYICTVTIISGCLRCTVWVLFPLVLSAVVPQDRFPAALALHMIFSGVLMLMADPILGVSVYVSGSYMYCFVAMSCCCLVCVLLWIAEYFVYCKRKK